MSCAVTCLQRFVTQMLQEDVQVAQIVLRRAPIAIPSVQVLFEDGCSVLSFPLSASFTIDHSTFEADSVVTYQIQVSEVDWGRIAEGKGGCLACRHHG